MKNLMSAVAALALFGLISCDFSESKYNDLDFYNASSYTVEVIPLTSEWERFTLAPGEEKSFGDVENPDYTWEPQDKVGVGVASDDRDVIFVNKIEEPEPDEPDPIIIIITNSASQAPIR